MFVWSAPPSLMLTDEKAASLKHLALCGTPSASASLPLHFFFRTNLADQGCYCCFGVTTFISLELTLSATSQQATHIPQHTRMVTFSCLCEILRLFDLFVKRAHGSKLLLRHLMNSLFSLPERTTLTKYRCIDVSNFNQTSSSSSTPSQSSRRRSPLARAGFGT